MRKFTTLACMFAIAASCSTNEIEQSGIQLPTMFGYTEEDGFTKTSLSVDSGGFGTIYWNPADRINVFFGTTSIVYTSTNTENATTASFEAQAINVDPDSDIKWGLYPFDPDAVCDGSSVTTVIHDKQVGVANSFAPGAFPMVANTTSDELHFLNVCGGIKFSLSRNDIRRITFKGNNDEVLAGTVQISLDANEKPTVSVLSGENTVIVTPENGDTFSSGTDYYVIVLPCRLSKGFTMLFETYDEIGTFEYSANPVEIKRSVFARKSDIDTYATFEMKPGFQLVDLGLSVMWGACNLGATKPEEYGDYYAWGATEPWYVAGDAQSTNTTWKSGRSSGYVWANCPYYVSSGKFTKYVYWKGSYWGGEGDMDSKSKLDLEDDAAAVNMGGNWRMPTRQEFSELLNTSKITSEWTSVNGVYGMKFTSNENGNSIFLPAACNREGTYFGGTGYMGSYWSSSLADNYTSSYFSPGEGWSLKFSLTTLTREYLGRYYGCSIRPVATKTYPVTSIVLDRTSATLKPGGIMTLIATVSPDNATDGTVIWSTSHAEIASVNNGVVTANKPGTATITAKAGDKAATCNVIVIEASDNIISEIGIEELN